MLVLIPHEELEVASTSSSDVEPLSMKILRENIRSRITAHILSSGNEDLIRQSKDTINAVSARIEAELFKAASSSSECLFQLEEYTTCEKEVFHKKLCTLCKFLISRIHRQRRKKLRLNRFV